MTVYAFTKSSIHNRNITEYRLLLSEAMNWSVWVHFMNIYTVHIHVSHYVYNHVIIYPFRWRWKQQRMPCRQTRPNPLTLLTFQPQLSSSNQNMVHLLFHPFVFFFFWMALNLIRCNLLQLWDVIIISH